MSDNRNEALARRRFLKLLGANVALLPLLGLTGCAGEQDAAPAKASKPEPPAAPPAASKPPAPASTSGQMTKPAPPATGMARLSLDDPQAKALAYVHDASTVDATKQPRYKAGQDCSNCVLYAGKAGDEWGGCSLFPGKAVNAKGWCTAYAPKPS